MPWTDNRTFGQFSSGKRSALVHANAVDGIEQPSVPKNSNNSSFMKDFYPLSFHQFFGS
jgi:hypothetical protein